MTFTANCSIIKIDRVICCYDLGLSNLYLLLEEKMKNNLLNNIFTEEDLLRRKYKNARNNLLLMIVFSVINIILSVANANTYFLFSAAVPYMLTDIGMFLCRRYPAEYYTGEFEGFQALPSVVFYVLLAISAIVLLLYLLAYIFSKNGKVGWLIFSLVLFSIDMGAMFMYYGINIGMILDIAFHIWVIVLLAIGIRAHYKLKELSSEEALEQTSEQFSDELSEESSGQSSEELQADSPVIRVADLEVKSRILLSFESFGHNVIYRRVKKVNELVIDGNVYAEYEALFEKSHWLHAILDGHEFSVGFDSISARSYGVVDGEIVSQKIRIF